MTDRNSRRSKKVWMQPEDRVQASSKLTKHLYHVIHQIDLDAKKIQPSIIVIKLRSNILHQTSTSNPSYANATS